MEDLSSKTEVIQKEESKQEATVVKDTEVAAVTVNSPFSELEESLKKEQEKKKKPSKAGKKGKGKQKGEELIIDLVPSQQKDEQPEEEETKVGQKGDNRKKNKSKRGSQPIPIREVEGGLYDEMGFYILPDEQGFYDPDGYFFNKDGFDDFGGYYDNEGFYHPGEKNKDEFPDYQPSTFDQQNDRKGGSKKGAVRRDDEEDDDIIAAFERGDNVDVNHEEDHHIHKYLNEYKTVEDVIGPVEDEDNLEQYDDEDYGDELQQEVPQIYAVPRQVINKQQQNWQQNKGGKNQNYNQHQFNQRPYLQGQQYNSFMPHQQQAIYQQGVQQYQGFNLYQYQQPQAVYFPPPQAPSFNVSAQEFKPAGVPAATMQQNPEVTFQVEEEKKAMGTAQTQPQPEKQAYKRTVIDIRKKPQENKLEAKKDEVVQKGEENTKEEVKDLQNKKDKKQKQNNGRQVTDAKAAKNQAPIVQATPPPITSAEKEEPVVAPKNVTIKPLQKPTTSQPLQQPSKDGWAQLFQQK